VFESISNSGAPGVVTGLAWKWIAADATPVAAFGDPLHTTGYRLCLYDASGRVSTATAPSGRGWNAAPTTVKYKSKTWAPTGIAGITLKAGLVPGAAKIAVKGKGSLLDVPSTATLASPSLRSSRIAAASVGKPSFHRRSWCRPASSSKTGRIDPPTRRRPHHRSATAL
jgi:hypothetical protein